MFRNVFGLAVISIVLMLCFQNCSDSTFQRMPDGSLQGSLLHHDPAKKLKIDGFNVDAEIEFIAPKLDIFIMIDNSPSMSNELRWMNENFLEYAEYLSESLRINLTLVSRIKQGDPESFILPKSNPNYKQIDLDIGSTDMLKDLGELIDGSHEFSNEMMSQWRQGVPKLFLLISDDNADLSAEEFLARIPKTAKKEDLVFNGVVGTSFDGSQNCGVRDIGKSYIDLASETGGKVYHICNPSWTGIFTDMVSDIKDKFGLPEHNLFRLSSEKIAKILAIRINGDVLATNEYERDGNRVTILNKAFLDRTDEEFSVEVEYIYE